MIREFQIGEEASKEALLQALSEIQTQGTGVLATLERARLASLVEFDRRNSAIAGRRTRALRVPIIHQSVRFIVSDFVDIDQTGTTGTVRADSNAATLKERAIPAEAVIKTNQFTTNTGTAESLDTNGTILQVHTLNGTIPTGQFDITLTAPLTLNQMVIDIVSTPSAPAIAVFQSADGLTYIESTQVALSGNRITAWSSSQETKFIRVQITPSHPDELNGDTYTFGITNFVASSSDYNLRSELVTRLISFTPESLYVSFDAPVDSNIQYYLSLSQTSQIVPFIEVNSGDQILIPGAAQIAATNIAVNSSGLIAQTIPSDIYLSTLVIKEIVSGLPIQVNLAIGLSSTDVNRTKMGKEYVTVSLGSGSSAGQIHLVRADGSYNTSRRFNVSFVHGPQNIKALLKVRLSTDDRATTSIFRGASLDVI